MSNEPKLTPVEIILKKKHRLLEIEFSDGFTFQYPCEYLRVFSPSAEVKTADIPEHSKSEVNIEDIQIQGTYAVLLVFDDGHDTGIYSWGTLYELGKNYEKNWRSYLARLEAHTLDRGGGATNDMTVEVKTINILYFMEMAKVVGMDEETVTLPPQVTTAESLLKWQRSRDPKWAKAFADENIQIMVNKQFAEAGTLLKSGDEVGFVAVDKYQD